MYPALSLEWISWFSLSIAHGNFSSFKLVFFPTLVLHCTFFFLFGTLPPWLHQSGAAAFLFLKGFFTQKISEALSAVFLHFLPSVKRLP